MLRLSHLMAIVPISILLTASFFVLFTMRKIEEKALKAFGYVVVGFLWLATLVVFSSAVYKMTDRSIATKYMMQRKMTNMPQMMRNDKVKGMAMPGKNTVIKDEKKSVKPKYDGNKGIF